MDDKDEHDKQPRIALSRADFIFTIGYDGPSAVVDGQAKKRYAGLSTAELLEKGLYRAAYSSALYSGKKDEAAAVIEKYHIASGVLYDSIAAMERLFGVFPVTIKRSIIL